MKEPFKKDFGPLADKGWSQLSERLDKELPTSTAAPKYRAGYKLLASVITLIGLMLITYSIGANKQNRKVAVLEPITTNITFDVPVAPLSIERPNIVKTIVNKVIITHNEPIEGHIISEVAFTPKQAKESLLLNEVKAMQIVSTLPRQVFAPTSNMASAHLVKRILSSSEKSIKPITHKKLPVLGFNLSSSANGIIQGGGVGGGMSVLFPISKKFSLEPGLGYGLMRYNNLPTNLSSEADVSFARVAPAPKSDLRYRLHQTIEMPLSVHYRPIEQLALTGGLDIDLLISQRMVFAQTENGLVGSAYAKSLNASEMNQLNRVNLGAHGGVSWFPVNEWKIGVYYGQNLLGKTKSDSKLKFSNQTYKVRLAHYF